jgi:hypothetical protein
MNKFYFFCVAFALLITVGPYAIGARGVTCVECMNGDESRRNSECAPICSLENSSDNTRIGILNAMPLGGSGPKIGKFGC